VRRSFPLLPQIARRSLLTRPFNFDYPCRLAFLYIILEYRRRSPFAAFHPGNFNDFLPDGFLRFYVSRRILPGGVKYEEKTDR